MGAPDILTAEQIEAIVRKAVRDEFQSAGLRLDDGDHQDEARRDFMFLRKMRTGVDGMAGKIGSAVILAIVSGVLFLIGLGAHSFMKQP